MSMMSVIIETDMEETLSMLLHLAERLEACADAASGAGQG